MQQPVSAKRVLRGRFDTAPDDGLVRTFRFHRDGTYEWMHWSLDEPGRLWECGRYELREGLLVLFKDPSERSCRGRDARPADPTAVVEQWMHRGRTRSQVIVLGGEAYRFVPPPAPQPAPPPASTSVLVSRLAP
jgi:hypothetical protein